MGKKRHSKDRLYLTTTEYQMEWGGKKDDIKIPYTRLPFFCCSLSLSPFNNPVCSPDGIVFDLVNIVPFIKKYKKNPVTGEMLKLTDLVKLNFHKNAKNEYFDPISYKVFTDYTHIVAIKTSGNVYAYDTIEELNKKPKFYNDLLTDQKFTFKDIITLQDPTNLEKRTVTNFDFIKKDIKFVPVNEKNKEKESNINQNGTGKRILENLQSLPTKEYNTEIFNNIPKKVVHIDENEDKESVAYYITECIQNNVFTHERFTTGKNAASLTSTEFDPVQSGEKENRKLIYNHIKGRAIKGAVQIVTNLGSLNFQLHCDIAPKTCENFLELCHKNYFDNTKFHRLIADFIIQGGDPTGTGKSGESIFGEAFEDEISAKLSHDKLGMLAMANSGPNSNHSQFFITLNNANFLDKKHTVFGQIVTGNAVLEKINTIKTNSKERPIIDIIIYSTHVIQNPFRDTIKKFKKDEEDKKKNEENKKKEKERDKIKWFENEETKFTLEPFKKDKKTDTLANSLLYGEIQEFLKNN